MNFVKIILRGKKTVNSFFVKIMRDKNTPRYTFVPEIQESILNIAGRKTHAFACTVACDLPGTLWQYAMHSMRRKELN